ncbi:heavy metal-associated isoprenylated plant protein 24-like [Nymphaea colorata]|uniref:heavy metal-associated isoprenylated plant protein 24-like n=1 Tax=Nymphaea colorata TaxID=210225 RepID=UPI00129D4346|nr:heavy metal-associated isoprenylated plant protein 24-like [Nymphaea colorata]
MESIECVTWELHVPINCCGGCKKQVKRKLLSIKGVHDVTLNPEIDKVSVTGNVRLDSLIKGLNKIKKQAKHWPERRAEYPVTEPAIAYTKNGESEYALPEATKELSVSSLLSEAAKGLSSAVGSFLGLQIRGSKNRDTRFELSPEGGTKVSAQSERVDLEFNFLAAGGKISYQKDVSYK